MERMNHDDDGVSGGCFVVGILVAPGRTTKPTTSSVNREIRNTTRHNILCRGQKIPSLMQELPRNDRQGFINLALLPLHSLGWTLTVSAADVGLF